MTKLFQVIKLNRFLKHIIILSILIIPLLGTGVGFATTTSNHQSVSIRTNKTVDSNSNQNIQASNLVYFTKNGFTNSTSINVTREVLVNSWAYTTIKDKVVIQSDEEFNAFTYTLPTSFYVNVDHFQMQVGNSTAAVFPTLSNATKYTTATFQFSPNVTAVQNETFTITMGVNSLFATNSSNQNYPYFISGFNFLPWFNFPMTNYQFNGGILSTSLTKSIENKTIVPDPASLGLTSSINVGSPANSLSNAYSTMQELPGFNFTTMSSEYPNAGSMKYIPAFTDNLASNMTIPAEVAYLIPQSPIIYTRSEVTVTISQWGSITYEEKTHLQNVGVAAFPISGSQSDTSVPIFVNANITSWSVTDGFGNLTNSKEQPNAGTNGYQSSASRVQIAPRSSIAPGGSFFYDLKYTVPNTQLMNETGGFFSPSWKLLLPAMSLFNWTNRHVDLTVIFPSISTVSLPSRAWGVNISYANMTNNGLLGIGQPVLSLSLDNFSSLDNNAALFYISVPPVIGPFFSVFQNAVYLFLVGLAIIIARVGFQKFSSYVEADTTGDLSIPFELMRDFVTAYEEKTALRTRLTELEKKRKNLRKVDYEQRVQTLKNKQIANDKKLVSVTSELIKVSPSYKDTVHNLELAEAERDQILAQITDLDLKKKQSRIRPEIYNKLKSEQNNRLNKSITRIERILNELRSLLQETR